MEQDRVIIDENINNTFSALSENPSSFRIKDYAHNLPQDYTNDLVFAIFEGAMTVSSKMTAKLILRQYRDESAGKTIDNKEFNELYNASKKANPNSKNEFLPVLFAYTQLVGGQKGLTNEENSRLIAQIINVIENDKKDKFPDKLYKDDEYTSSVGLEIPKISNSFLSEIESFYNNIFANETSSKVFDKIAIDSTLNQYIDDIYSLSSTEDKVNEIAFYKRSASQFGIEKVETEKINLIKDEKNADIQTIKSAILYGYKQPIYKNNNYNFSYITESMNLLKDNCDAVIDEFNKANEEKLVLPTLEGGDTEEYRNASKMFVSSYVASLFVQKQHNNGTLVDPYRIVDPNMKLSLLRANEYLYSTGLKSDEMIEEIVEEDVKNLIKISVNLANFLENSKEFELPKEVDTKVIQSKEVEPKSAQDVFAVSSKEVVKYMLHHLGLQNKVYIDEILRIKKIEENRNRGLHYKRDDAAYNEYVRKYTSLKPSDVKPAELINIIDSEADKLFLALTILQKRINVVKIASVIENYNSPNTPTVVKEYDVKFLNNFIEKELIKNRCNSAKVITTVKNIFNEALILVPAVKQQMTASIKDEYSKLKTDQAYKKTTEFSNAIAPVLRLNKEKCNTTYRLSQKILAKRSLKLNQKYAIPAYVKDILEEVAADLDAKDFKDEAKKLQVVAEKFDLDNNESYIQNGVMSNGYKTLVKKELRDVHKAVRESNKTSKDDANIENLVDNVPKLINKIPTSKDLAKKNFIDFICELNPDMEEEIKTAYASELRFVVKDGVKDPFEIKDKFKNLVAEENLKTFEELWKGLPKITEKTRNKLIVKSRLANLIKELDSDKRIEYMNYFKVIFPSKNEVITATTKKDEQELRKYKAFARQKLVELFDNENADEKDINKDSVSVADIINETENQ